MIERQIPDELDESDYQKYDHYALATELGRKLNKANAELTKLRRMLSGDDFEHQCSTCKHAAVKESVEPCKSCVQELRVFHNHEAL